MLHFLATISDDSWNGHVGSFLLLTFGPGSVAQLQRSYYQLRQTPRTKAFELDPAALGDFSVRQVWAGGEDSDLDVLTDFFDEANDSDDPLWVPLNLLEELLPLAKVDPELKISRLPLFQHGSLECAVYLEDTFDGRAFLLNGDIDLERLASYANIVWGPTHPLPTAL